MDLITALKVFSLFLKLTSSKASGIASNPYQYLEYLTDLELSQLAVHLVHNLL